MQQPRSSTRRELLRRMASGTAATTGATALAGCTGILETGSSQRSYRNFLSGRTRSDPIESEASFSILHPSRSSDSDPLHYSIGLIRDSLFYVPPNVRYGDITREVVGRQLVGINGRFDRSSLTQNLRNAGWSAQRTLDGHDIVSKHRLTIAVTDGVAVLAHRGDTETRRERIRRLIEGRTKSATGQFPEVVNTLMDALDTGLYTHVQFAPAPDYGLHAYQYDNPGDWTAAFSQVKAVGQSISPRGNQVECITSVLVDGDANAHASAMKTNIVAQGGYGPIAYASPSVSTTDSRVTITETRPGHKVDF